MTYSSSIHSDTGSRQRTKVLGAFFWGHMTKKVLFTLTLVVASSSTLAEKWTNAGTFTVAELGKPLVINVYGDADSATRSGDFASLLVRGFSGDPMTAQKVMFECTKGEIIWQNGEKANVNQDYKGEYATLPRNIMTRLHTIACKKWFEVWK